MGWDVCVMFKAGLSLIHMSAFFSGYCEILLNTSTLTFQLILILCFLELRCPILNKNDT